MKDSLSGQTSPLPPSRRFHFSPGELSARGHGLGRQQASRNPGEQVLIGEARAEPDHKPTRRLFDLRRDLEQLAPQRIQLEGLRRGGDERLARVRCSRW